VTFGTVREVRGRAGATLRTLWDDEGAPTAVEYGLMLAGVAAAIFASVVVFGQSVMQVFDSFVARWP